MPVLRMNRRAMTIFSDANGRTVSNAKHAVILITGKAPGDFIFAPVVSNIIR